VVRTPGKVRLYPLFLFSCRAYGNTWVGSRGNRPSRGNFPPYIHFTLQKTNRDTHDALSYIARFLHANIKDLGVAGTKDKRGVTVQRVSLKRGNRIVEDVWKTASSQNSRNLSEDSTKRRGDHGVRIADINYRKAPLELGMLKGNQFIITLRYASATSVGHLLIIECRNVQVESVEALESAMNTMKHGGFINYYGELRHASWLRILELVDFRNAEIWNCLDSNPFDRFSVASVRLA
jgi:tRNA pseudouridine13 synthase